MASAISCISRCRISSSTSPRPTTSCAATASSSASAISWARRASRSVRAAGATARTSAGNVSMSPELYLAFLLACVVIMIVPGPTVTLIIANALTHGTRAGLLNVAGTQLGMGLMIAVVVVGLASLVEAMGFWFEWLRLAGAAYLIWLGIKLIRSSGAAADR